MQVALDALGVAYVWKWISSIEMCLFTMTLLMFTIFSRLLFLSAFMFVFSKI